ncbi:ferritin-like domain-containing protein [Haloprofundus halobius]|uniref:ferritin-like domain-containing protein n=1 Tax=Haloprofundus halobius TaxID=2876194 RepID=UPI001CCA4491|nr:ferritin-like protein [Haloprofundus halobius]
MTIDTSKSLREHLQWAIRVELSTIPAYLYAMYSIDDDASVPYRLIRSVVVEEMLHAALVANVLAAVGGEPQFYDEAVVPSYPMALPHHRPEIVLDLERASPEVIDRVFATIERPREVGGLPEDDDYETIEQFYMAVEEAVDRLDAEAGLFEADRIDRQMAEPEYYAPVEYDSEESGGLHPVTDWETAARAIETIVHQGEGYREAEYADPDHHEQTHYYKFKQIADGTHSLGGTRPVPTNPLSAEYPARLRPAADLFNACYSYLYVLLDGLYSPVDAETKDDIVLELYGVMMAAMRPLARWLTEQPLGDVDGTGDTDGHAAPTFEFYRFDGDPTEELHRLADEVTDRNPELAHVHGALVQLRGVDR